MRLIIGFCLEEIIFRINVVFHNILLHGVFIHSDITSTGLALSQNKFSLKKEEYCENLMENVNPEFEHLVAPRFSWVKLGGSLLGQKLGCLIIGVGL